MKAAKNEVIADQARELHALRKTVKEQGDLIRRREEITARQKRELGESQHRSWDCIWPEVVAKVRSYDAAKG